jgi:hypothetical protein
MDRQKIACWLKEAPADDPTRLEMLRQQGCRIVATSAARGSQGKSREVDKADKCPLNGDRLIGRVIFSNRIQKTCAR